MKITAATLNAVRKASVPVTLNSAKGKPPATVQVTPGFSAPVTANLPASFWTAASAPVAQVIAEQQATTAAARFIAEANAPDANAVATGFHEAPPEPSEAAGSPAVPILPQQGNPPVEEESSAWPKLGVPATGIPSAGFLDVIGLAPPPATMDEVGKAAAQARVEGEYQLDVTANDLPPVTKPKAAGLGGFALALALLGALS